MSFNLVELALKQFGGPALGQLGALLGEDNNKTESALGALVPGLLSGLTAQAKSDGGASLFNAVNDTDDSMLDNIGGLLTGGNSNTVMEQGSGLLGSLLGNGAVGGLASAVAGLSGLGGKSSSGLMGLVAPIILGLIKRKLFGGGGFSQNAGGLLSLLDSQQEHVQAAMPAGFSNQLQSSGFMDQLSGLGGGVAGAVSGAASAAGDVAGNVAGAAGDAVGGAAGTVAGAAGHAASSGGGLLRKLIPAVVLAALAFFGYKMFSGGAPEMPDVEGMKNAATDAMPSMPSISVGDTDVGAAFTNVFSTATETVGGITDLETAKAAIPQFEGITGNVDKLSGLWDQVPEAGRGPIGSLIGDNLGKLTPALDKVNEIPGVAGVLGPVTGPLLEKLQGFIQ